MSDESLINLIRLGDTKAFEIVYAKYYDLLYSFATHITQQPSIAVEVVDDVMFNLWLHRTDYTVSSLKGFLIRSVRNRSINELKSPFNRHKNVFMNIADDDVMNFINSLMIDSNHPLGYLLEKELDNVMNNALESLPDKCRQVFEMSRFNNKKNAEIAEELGISVNTVKYHIHHAMQIMSSYLVKYMLIFLLSSNITI